MQTNFKKLSDIKVGKGQRVILRLDINLDIEHGVIVDDYRIKMSLPTIQALIDAGARVIIIGHLEGKEGVSGKPSLKPVFEYLKNVFPNMNTSTASSAPSKLCFYEGAFDQDFEMCIGGVGDGGIVLVENIRNFPEEKSNDEAFARKIASFADLYVNEAFSVSHRQHASIVGIPKFLPAGQAVAGPLFCKEVEELSKAFIPQRPFLFIIGGAKFETKIPLVQKFLQLADFVFIGGALANDCFKSKGFEIGQSIVSKHLDEIGPIIADIVSDKNAGKIFLPKDVTVTSGDVSGTNSAVSSESVSRAMIKDPTNLSVEDRMVDCGPETVALLGELIQKSRLVLWNGPLGIYEEGFKQPTKDLASLIANSSAYSIVGGGDTLASITEQNLGSKFGFVSTAGGAMLDFLAEGTLPGIEVLRE